MTTNEPLYPAQLQAFEKLKRLRVGALYIDRQDGKLRTVAELVRYRLKRGRIEGVLWLCTRRRVELICAGIEKYAPEEARCIEVCGIETLSHNLGRFLEMLGRTEEKRLMLVIDNGLLIKNPEALRTQRIIALSEKCHYRLLVSDVPFSKNAADVFSQWYALDWRILGYRTYYGFSINHVNGKNALINTEYIARAIEPYCAQVLREDVQQTAERREFVWKFQLPQAAIDEYHEVMERFLWKAMLSNTGVYRLLHACQHVISGRRVIQDYPLVTEPMYADPGDDPRLNALMEVVGYCEGSRLLILCRYAHECETVLDALRRKYGEKQAARYGAGLARYTVMNIFADEREKLRLAVDAVIYYSNDWDWRKRQEKERQCQNALHGGTLTVVSLVAADTVDYRILKSVWAKDDLVRRMRDELKSSFQRREKTNAQII